MRPRSYPWPIPTLFAAILGPWLAPATLAQSPTAAPTAAPATPAQPAPGILEFATPGPFTVKVIDETWTDPARARAIPVRIYIPERAGASATGLSATGSSLPVRSTSRTQNSSDPGNSLLPLIIFSHGLGGSGRNYRYFGEHMASRGFIVIAPTHPGSDTAALRDYIKKHGGMGSGSTGWLQSSINDPDNLLNRPKDTTFIIDQALAGTRDAIKGRIDASRIGVAGHSFGAYTAMAIGGMTIDLPPTLKGADKGGTGVSFRDARVKAILPMSPEGPGTMGITAASWDHMAAPVLYLTGTKDYGSGGRSAGWRRAAFDHTTTADACLVVLTDATHMTFGRGAGGARAEQAATPGAPEQPAAKPPAHEGLRERIRDRLQKNADQNTAPDAGHDYTTMIDALCASFFEARLNQDAGATAAIASFFAPGHPARADCTAESHAAAK